MRQDGIEELENVRGPVRYFSEEMERVLKRNDWKGGWESSTQQDLEDKLAEEIREYFEDGRDPEELLDIANFCMMLYWIKKKRDQ